MAVTTASMTFMERDSWPPDEKPYIFLYEPTGDIMLQNYKDASVGEIPIHDMRPHLEQLSLDKEGFKVCKIETSLSYEDFHDEEKLRAVYAEEVRHCLLDLLGARAAYIHECVIRQRGFRTPAENKGYGQPIAHVHTDYTEAYIEKLIGQLAGEQAELIMKSRHQMINVWKPLRGPLRDWPLALCDLKSLERSDLHRLDEVHRHDVLESHLVTYRPSQKWYFLSDQVTYEALIFKSMDSEIRGGGKTAAIWDFIEVGTNIDKCPTARSAIHDIQMQSQERVLNAEY